MIFTTFIRPLMAAPLPSSLLPHYTSSRRARSTIRSEWKTSSSNSNDQENRHTYKKKLLWRRGWVIPTRAPSKYTGRAYEKYRIVWLFPPKRCHDDCYFLRSWLLISFVSLCSLFFSFHIPHNTRGVRLAGWYYSHTDAYSELFFIFFCPVVVVARSQAKRT